LRPDSVGTATVLKLPKNLESFVEAEFLVTGQHRNVFAQNLGDDLALVHQG
jgi:hypothetical protein